MVKCSTIDGSSHNTVQYVINSLKTPKTFAYREIDLNTIDQDRVISDIKRKRKSVGTNWFLSKDPRGSGYLLKAKMDASDINVNETKKLQETKDQFEPSEDIYFVMKEGSIATLHEIYDDRGDQVCCDLPFEVIL